MEVAQDFKDLLRQAGQLVRQHRWLLIGAFLFAVAGVVFLLPFDPLWAPKPDVGVNPTLRHLATELRFWGDYQTGSLLIAGLLWLLGRIWRIRNWRVAALACLLAATFAGLEVNVVRFTAGRPRPSVKVPDRLHGPTLDTDYHSFPSAHSATSFGTAGALAVALPPIGVPALFGAVAVAWSRLYLKSHYPTDVWMGAWVGMLNGIVFGSAARRLFCRQASLSMSTPANPARQPSAGSTIQRR
ncbi:MAG TPA: phosphatase PAP2 family protein [Verrucomicrobiae bacterium]|nr:phosphatase PAP2 family protein [Verrucomicrobiae bacterium]